MMKKFCSIRRGEQYAHQRAFVNGLIRKGLLKGESYRKLFRAFPLPISGPWERTSAESTLLCGDAGGSVNTFTAEGIYSAMESGELAAHAAIETMKKNDLSDRQLALYEPAWKKKSVTIWTRAWQFSASL